MAEDVLLQWLWTCLDYKNIFANKASFNILGAAKFPLEEKAHCTKALTELATESWINR